jgi:hypothetical protein
MRRHIPGANGKTFCGLRVESVTCIDPVRDCIEDAECRRCQRSDDRRTREQFVQSDEYKRQIEESGEP